jgi:signal transduction histidine kinase
MDRLLPTGAFSEPWAVATDWSGDGKRYRLLSYRIDGWTYQLATDQRHDQCLFARYRQNLLSAIVPTVALGLVGGYVLARRGLRPLREATAAVRVVSPSRLGDRIPVVDLPAELLALADAFNGVMDRLQEAFTRLDQFSADIAHELRTPVHNLRGGVEVALSWDRTPDEYRRTLDGVRAEADRLNRLSVAARRGASAAGESHVNAAMCLRYVGEATKPGEVGGVWASAYHTPCTESGQTSCSVTGMSSS